MTLAKRVYRSIHNELTKTSQKKNMIDFQKVNLSLIINKLYRKKKQNV